VGMYCYAQEVIDSVTYEFFTEKSLQYLSGQTDASAAALKSIAQYLRTAAEFCKEDVDFNDEGVWDVDFFILLSQAISPQGSLKEFRETLLDYSHKIDALLAGDESHKDNIKGLLLNLRETLEQHMLLNSDKKARWRL